MPTTRNRAAIYAIYAFYVPPMLSADAGLRARLSSRDRRDVGLVPLLDDLARVIRSLSTPEPDQDLSWKSVSTTCPHFL